MLTVVQFCNVADDYRATLCVSAVFAVTRCPSERLSVCPSVRPSVTLVHCIQTVEDIVILSSRPGSPTILVFLTRAPVPNSAGAQNTGVGKFCDFPLKSPFISETVRDRSMIAMER